MHTVGTEIDISKRQQLFIIKDMIYNTVQSKVTTILSGSLAEGLNLTGSDIDMMCVIKDLDVIWDVRNIKQPVKRTTPLIETDNDHPGFSRLRLIPGGDGKNEFITNEYFERTRNGIHLSVNECVGR